jgi:DNA-binding FrmR family transcriptional regulator
MNSVSKLILKNHMKSCLIKRIQAGELDVVDELLYTIEKMLK